MRKKYIIKGMSCASCSAHVQKAVDELKDVKCEVHLVTNTMDVEGQFSDKEIIEAVEKAGYGCIPYESEYIKKQEKTVNNKKIRLFISIGLLIVLMYIAMGPMIGLKLPFFLEGKYILINLYAQFVITVITMILNINYFTSGFSKLFKLRPNMDTLVAIGSLSGFIYACVTMVQITINYNSNFEHASHLMHMLYFDSEAMVLTLVSVGKYLEGLSKKKTTKALDMLLDLVPKQVLCEKNGQMVLVDIDDVEVGEIIEIRPYDIIPLDGVVCAGSSNVDEASITGESMFKFKEANDPVLSGTKNQEGIIRVKVTKSSTDSTIAEIISLVEKASSSKMNIEKLVDRVSLFFVPIVIIISIITFVVWLIISQDISIALKMFISVLVISCPCGLGLATPLCVMVSTLFATKNHILIKDAEVFEKLNNIDVVLCDKTGTITNGRMEVVDYDLDDVGLLSLESLESLSNHPLSKAVQNISGKPLYDVSNFQTIAGRGINGIINGRLYYAGNYDYLKSVITDLNIEVSNNTSIYLFTDSVYLGHIEFKDLIKPTSMKTIKLFQKHNIKTIMLTGDNEKIANKIGHELGIDEVKSQMLPQDKAKVVEEYMNQGHKVMMIGDGINDSVALEYATVGISMNETNIARTSADIVLTRSDLLDSYNAYLISKKTVKNIKINLFWAFIYNIIAIPIAAGVFYSSFGIQLNPMIASICMSASSLFICLNALRLNNIKLERKDNNMIFYVKDMMCPKCVAHVSEALKSIGVENVEIDLKKKKVTVSTTKEEREIFEAIEKAGYHPTKK